MRKRRLRHRYYVDEIVPGDMLLDVTARRAPSLVLDVRVLKDDCMISLLTDDGIYRVYWYKTIVIECAEIVRAGED